MGLSGAQLMKLLMAYRLRVEQGKKVGTWVRLKWAFAFGFRLFSFLKGEATEVIAGLEKAFYRVRKAEIERELAMREERLQALELEVALEALTTSSRQMLRHKMAERFGGGTRRQFTVSGIKANTEVFLKEYPVVLSSTYKSNTNIHSDYVFDYVIMDEASQVDIKTGALALSCAMNAVIVGDSKQLPNVVSQADVLAYGAVRANYAVGDCYDAVKCSFLQSCIEVFRDAPTTLLREHYRCHPKIISFCNQRFYDGALLAMTTDEGESKVLQVVRTVEGNHARGHFNQREIDVLMQEVLPEYMGKGSLGIITPYRDQAEAINRAVGQELASTVHKYQGRECDTIIMSMVDNAPTDFSDDANLLNVAISRAKTRLCVIATGNELPEESNLSQLINYIRYNNFEVRESQLHSVFDLLYQQYSAERLRYQTTHSAVSDHLSENLLYDALQQALSEMGRSALAVVCHYPLSKLIADPALLDAEERAFVESPFSHVDFLIYNVITKRPELPIEVDGWGFHGGNSIQQHRDALKDGLLAKYGLSPCRISTTDRVTVEVLKELLAKRGLVDELQRTRDRKSSGVMNLDGATH
jgi:putative ATP/GTP-binding protein